MNPGVRISTFIENYTGITNNMLKNAVFHRALADSEMTANLWLHMLKSIKEKYMLTDISFSLMQQLSNKSKNLVHDFLKQKSLSTRLKS